MPNGRELRFSDELVVRVPAPEECLAVRKNEWAWLKRDIEAIRVDVPWLATAGNLLLGAGISAFFSALGLHLVVSSERPSWLLPVAWSACVVCLVLGIVFFVLAKREGKQATQTIDAVLLVMRSIEATADPVSEGIDGARLRVIEATYGTRENSNDVASRLVSQIVNGRLDIDVNNAAMGGDPAPGIVKQLFVRYEAAGSEANKVVKEGERLVLP